MVHLQPAENIFSTFFFFFFLPTFIIVFVLFCFSASHWQATLPSGILKWLKWAELENQHAQKRSLKKIPVTHHRDRGDAMNRSRVDNDTHFPKVSPAGHLQRRASRYTWKLGEIVSRRTNKTEEKTERFKSGYQLCSRCCWSSGSRCFAGLLGGWRVKASSSLTSTTVLRGWSC